VRGDSRQTLSEPDTALLVAELALAEARRVGRTEADVEAAAAAAAVEGTTGQAARQIMAEGALKEASRKHAQALLADAQQALVAVGAGQGPCYARHLLLERRVLAQLAGGRDPVEEAMAAGLFGGAELDGAMGLDEGLLQRFHSMQELFLGGVLGGGSGGGVGSTKGAE
jgi:hypothetical protein